MTITSPDTTEATTITDALAAAQILPVRVYSKPACMQCEMTKRMLTAEHVPFVVEDVTDPDNLAAAQYLGHLAAPVVVAGRDHWSGFQPERIKEIAARINEGENA